MGKEQHIIVKKQVQEHQNKKVKMGGIILLMEKGKGGTTPELEVSQERRGLREAE